MADGLQGWGALGDMLAGNVGTPGVYDTALKGAAATDKAMMDARRARSMAIIDGVRADNFVQIPTMGGELGISDAQARLMAAGGGNAQQLAGALGGLQGQGFRQAAVDAAVLGDPGAANAQLFGVANGPVDLTKITDGMAFNPIAAPADAGMAVTPLGEATIRQRDASAAASGARAQSTRARLGIAQQQFGLQRAGQWNPSGNVAPTGKRTQPAEAVLKRAFETTDPANPYAPSAFDQERYLDFERWWAANPQIADGNKALAQYQLSTASGLGGPIFIEPGLPGSMTQAPPAPARPTSKAEFDALPSGTQFIAPDGSMRIKP